MKPQLLGALATVVGLKFLKGTILASKLLANLGL
jgi:hypothetical protein